MKKKLGDLTVREKSYRLKKTLNSIEKTSREKGLWAGEYFSAKSCKELIDYIIDLEKEIEVEDVFEYVKVQEAKNDVNFIVAETMEVMNEIEAAAGAGFPASAEGIWDLLDGVVQKHLKKE